MDIMLTASSGVSFLTDNLTAITSAVSSMFTSIVSSPAALFLAISAVGGVVALCYKIFRGSRK